MGDFIVTDSSNELSPSLIETQSRQYHPHPSVRLLLRVNKVHMQLILSDTVKYFVFFFSVSSGREVKFQLLSV